MVQRQLVGSAELGVLGWNSSLDPLGLEILDKLFLPQTLSFLVCKMGVVILTAS